MSGRKATGGFNAGALVPCAWISSGPESTTAVKHILLMKERKAMSFNKVIVGWIVSECKQPVATFVLLKIPL